MPLSDEQADELQRLANGMGFGRCHDAILNALDELKQLHHERAGWKNTALAIRDAAIYWDKDGVNRYERIEQMYFDAAMFGRFASTYHDDRVTALGKQTNALE